MKTVTISVRDTADWRTIDLGRRGEDGTTQVLFDISALAEIYGSGTVVLMVRRHAEAEAYPAVTEQDGDTVTWVITDVETAKVGKGSCELWYYVDDALAKTIVYKTRVVNDLVNIEAEAPDPYEIWIDHLTELGQQTQAASSAAAGSTTDAAAAAATAVNAKTAAAAAKAAAEAAETGAEAQALKAEGFAVGKQNGQDVSSDSPYYENNAEYMKDAAALYALSADAAEGEAAAWATGSYSGDPSGIPVPGTAAQHNNNAYYYAQQAAGSATAAGNAQTAAETAQGKAETAASHYPEIGSNDHWYVWDVEEEQYVDTGIQARGSGSGPTDAGDVTYDDTETYQEGTVGDELSELNQALTLKQDATSYVTLSGTTVTQTGADNTMYLCGELAELTFTAPQTGMTAVRFTSGSTPTVVTFSGVTAWLNGFDPDEIEASKTYEINILNGVGCAAWT